MKINGTPYRSVWLDADGRSIRIFDQTRLPWAVEELVLSDEEAVAHAIRSMQVRGAPLIGAVGAYGLAMALRRDPSIENLERSAAMLNETRPTAVNLKWALDRICAAVRNHPPERRAEAAYAEAAAICDDDVETNRKIGEHGLELLKEIAARKPPGEPVRVLTHCNAGWIATVDYGTALSPIYQAHDAGMDVHVWVDETRPRNQGALTAWELGSHGVPHTFVTDNAGGHLMQHGMVDIVIVGTDRVTRNGDVANKIGTYLKALAAKDNDIPFWVALPHSTLDMSVRDGLTEIPIEERSSAEVTATTGRLPKGGVGAIRVAPESSPAANPAFDVTPARLVTGLITERGRCGASEEALSALYPEKV
ncbi:S-methyl-5-thioribose-1-phosphate isomerase [Roseomonas indoligenes]|uniref:Methylthioribose-1-phosphate isomerase n=1 Tax=Roseomonas indoligenes TaxID=2820811 RepID=A0A940N1X3_9PROT|nr:S-methyl-5-thioribose-1-phosphate isomerase [Pararoseomonas indoligenes]MBP0492727.1 S-methyl-5-thioribose-1-phosphate isomerase [Pararoseomonas indoligenes]